jgi:hypothetical protein
VVDYLYAKTLGKDGKAHDNPYLLHQLGHQASKECKDMIPQVFHKTEQQRNQTSPDRFEKLLRAIPPDDPVFQEYLKRLAVSINNSGVKQGRKFNRAAGFSIS